MRGAGSARLGLLLVGLGIAQQVMAFPGFMPKPDKNDPTGKTIVILALMPANDEGHYRCNLTLHLTYDDGKREDFKSQVEVEKAWLPTPTLTHVFPRRVAGATLTRSCQIL